LLPTFYPSLSVLFSLSFSQCLSPLSLSSFSFSPFFPLISDFLLVSLSCSLSDKWHTWLTAAASPPSPFAPSFGRWLGQTPPPVVEKIKAFHNLEGRLRMKICPTTIMRRILYPTVNSPRYIFIQYTHKKKMNLINQMPFF